MTPITKNFERSDIADFDEIVRTAKSYNTEIEADVATCYRLLGELLLRAVRQVGLDEDVQQLMVFARNIARETLSAESREKHFPRGCWAVDVRSPYPPFRRKVDGNNSSSSEIHPDEITKTALVFAFSWQMRYDPELLVNSRLLVEYMEKNGLWPNAVQILEY